MVESDESVDNFDPEFTTMDMREAGLEDMFDEEDPSEDWVALSQSLSAPVHTPNGPLGFDKQPQPLVVPPPLNGHTNGHAKGIDIANKKKKREPVGSPLTNSMQENFRGFTYHGEASLIPDGAAGILKEQADRERELALQDDEFVPDFDVDDEEGLVGRYANKRRGDDLDAFEDMRF